MGCIMPFHMPQELLMETVSRVSQAMQTVLTILAEEADATLHYTKRPDSAN